MFCLQTIKNSLEQTVEKGTVCLEKDFSKSFLICRSPFSCGVILLKQIPFYRSIIVPGLSIPLGSKALFTPCIIAISLAVYWRGI